MYHQLTSATHEMVFQIRSIYVTDVSDMLYAGTGSLLSWRTSFVEHMQEKNQVKALDNDQITALDQYLRLSTCYGFIGTSKRLAVHRSTGYDEGNISRH
jgi:sortase B